MNTVPCFLVNRTSLLSLRCNDEDDISVELNMLLMFGRVSGDSFTSWTLQKRLSKTLLVCQRRDIYNRYHRLKTKGHRATEREKLQIKKDKVYVTNDMKKYKVYIKKDTCEKIVLNN